jgi:hypothetical protein
MVSAIIGFINAYVCFRQLQRYLGIESVLVFNREIIEGDIIRTSHIFKAFSEV